MYSSQPSEVDRILGSLTCYRDRGRVGYDVNIVMGQIRSLRARAGNLTHNNGTVSTLLNLFGTIPIFYMGNQYNIPVEMWVLEPYPVAPPQVYVRPTQDMIVKPGHRHVDRNGVVYLPYLSEWRPQTHNLIELIGHMSSIFGHDPPVYRKPSPTPPLPHAVSSATYTSSMSSVGSTSSVSSYGTSTTTYTSSSTAQGSFRAQPSVQPSPPKKDPIEEARESVTYKLQAELPAVYKEIRDEVDRHFEDQVRMEAGRERVQVFLGDMKKEKEQLEHAIRITKEKDEELGAWLEEHEKPEFEIDVDDALRASDTWSKQLLETMAEYNAIEDALYFLDKALSDDTIDLQTFLKEVRNLSRRQFMLKALAMKIYEMQRKVYGAGVGTLSGSGSGISRVNVGGHYPSVSGGAVSSARPSGVATAYPSVQGGGIARQTQPTGTKVPSAVPSGRW